MRIVGTLKLERYDKNFRLLERRVQPMRSWTKGLIDILYGAHASIQVATTFPGMYCIDRTPRDATLKADVSGAWNMENWGFIGGPPGFTALNNKAYTTGFLEWEQGCDVGIQVGTDNTAATPTDRRLYHRIGHGIRPADGGDVTFESYDAGDDAEGQIITDDNRQRAQGFRPRNDFRCSSVEVKVDKVLAPAGPLTVEIRAPGMQVNPWNVPSTTVLATGTIAAAAIGAAPGAFVACVFGTHVDLYAGRQYFIVLHSAGVDGANYFQWRYDSAGATYDRNVKVDDGSISWVGACSTANAWVAGTRTDGACHMFRAIGRSIGEFEYGGCEIVHRVTANPNDAFDIRRFFYNRSGGVIAVAEVGIQAQFRSYVNPSQKINETLIARDVVGPAVNVANTEILQVTYTPAITV
jgi:hypothetical protein